MNFGLYKLVGKTLPTFLFYVFSYALFDKNGQQVPQEIVTKVGETFEKILKEVLQSLGLRYYLSNAFSELRVYNKLTSC